jgi:hypothetical protein
VVNIVTLTVENPDQILNAGAYGTGAIVRLQSATDSGGPFTDISGTGSTPSTAVIAGTRSYLAYDPNGLATTWYRTRYENVGASRVSDWSDAFQSGDETAGFLCSVYDVEQAVGSLDANEREDVIETIREVTDAIQLYTGRLFVRTPLEGTADFLMDVEVDSTSLWVPEGIAELGSIDLAYGTGQTYGTLNPSDYFLDPIRPYPGWTWTRIVLSDVLTGGFDRFYEGYRTVRFNDSALGWPAVPPVIQGIAKRAVIRRHLGKGAGGTVVATGPAGTEILLPDMSGSDRQVLESYRRVSMH